jgi:hypothetical protein
VAAIAVPVAVATAIVVVFVLTGVFAVWMLWALAGWWFFGRRRRRCGVLYTGSWQASRRGGRDSRLQPPRGSWV